MNERQVSNKALGLADVIENITTESEEFGNVSDRQTLFEAATMLRSQEKYINQLHKLCNLNGLGAGRDLLTGEVIPFEVNYD